MTICLIHLFHHPGAARTTDPLSVMSSRKSDSNDFMRPEERQPHSRPHALGQALNLFSQLDDRLQDSFQSLFRLCVRPFSVAPSFPFGMPFFIWSRPAFALSSFSQCEGFGVSARLALDEPLILWMRVTHVSVHVWLHVQIPSRPGDSFVLMNRTRCLFWAGDSPFLEPTRFPCQSWSWFGR